MESVQIKVRQSLWNFMNEVKKESDPYIRSINVSGDHAENSSVWLCFKDGSGHLKRFDAKEGLYIPLVSEVGGLLVSSLTFGFGHNFSTHWATHYIYLFDENDTCILGVAISSAYNYKLKDLLEKIEYDVSEAEASSEKDDEDCLWE